jgi:hypothetical protein
MEGYDVSAAQSCQGGTSSLNGTLVVTTDGGLKKQTEAWCLYEIQCLYGNRVVQNGTASILIMFCVFILHKPTQI